MTNAAKDTQTPTFTLDELSTRTGESAERCGHCCIVSPLVEELADDYEGRENERR